jgi:hypothetical protein
MKYTLSGAYSSMACGIFLLSVLLFSASISWTAESVVHEKWQSTMIQYWERTDRLDETARGAYERDWYEDAYEEYEESPYGYYEEDSFYRDFDFHYWDRNPRGDWYEERFRQYSRDYLNPAR